MSFFMPQFANYANSRLSLQSQDRAKRQDWCPRGFAWDGGHGCIQCLWRHHPCVQVCINWNQGHDVVSHLQTGRTCWQVLGAAPGALQELCNMAQDGWPQWGIRKKVYTLYMCTIHIHTVYVCYILYMYYIPHRYIYIHNSQPDSSSLLQSS